MPGNSSSLPQELYMECQPVKSCGLGFIVFICCICVLLIEFCLCDRLPTAFLMNYLWHVISDHTYFVGETVVMKFFSAVEYAWCFLFCIAVVCLCGLKLLLVSTWLQYYTVCSIIPWEQHSVLACSRLAPRLTSDTSV